MLLWGIQRLSFIVCGCGLTPRRRHKEVRAIYQPRALQLFPLWLKGARIPLPDFIYVVITNLTTFEGISRKISHVAFKADIQFGSNCSSYDMIFFSQFLSMNLSPFPILPLPHALFFNSFTDHFSISIQQFGLKFRLFLSTLFLNTLFSKPQTAE